jgi:hypothetical protein
MSRFHVTIQYGTPRGRASAWSGDVEAADVDSAYAAGKTACARSRAVGKVWGGDVVPYGQAAPWAQTHPVLPRAIS